MLLEAILDYLQRIKSLGDHKGNRSDTGYIQQILIDFLFFAIDKGVVWENMFAFDTFREFRKGTNLKNTSHALIELSRYLHDNGKIPEPLQIPNYQVELPRIYEQYLIYHEQTRELPHTRINSIRRVLASLHQYLEGVNIDLFAIKIEHLDAFMAEFNKRLAPGTCRIYRYHLRQFLKYLYHERAMLKKDLAPLLVGAPLFDQQKPPKFLRPRELQKLFAGLTLSTPSDLRTTAMVHLAYTLGLRPVEISRITLDDISFQKGELTIRQRKNNNPTTLPLPEQTIKAMAAYLLNVRPKSPHRELFLRFTTPYKPATSAVVTYHISKAMKRSGLPSTSYWLRHTYAQNLLQERRSIYEIKEMLGHETIKATQRYLHIDTELMRKVLFNETL